jgi:hypothetical protein
MTGEDTQLDRAHEAMQANLEDDAARMGFYQAVADAELFLLLAGEPEGGNIEPELLEMDGERFALVFDAEWRLANFTEEHLPGQALPFAALPGRAIAGLLEGQKIGLGLNLGVAPSSILIPDAALTWLASALAQTPEQVATAITGITAPESLPDALVTALIAKLTPAGGLAQGAALATAQFSDGSASPILGFIAPMPGAEEALARAAQEALTFSGVEDLALEVGFFSPHSTEAQSFASIGQPIPLPAPQAVPKPEPANPKAPGSDPAKPPILK